MVNNKNFLNKSFLLNLFISFIPISFILGNLILNLNIALFIILSFIIYKNKIFSFELNYFDKLIVIFFIYILLVAFLNYFGEKDVERNSQIVIKSILFLRFILLYFIFRFLINENIINFSIFYLVCSLSVLFVALDIIYQFYNGFDIFGFEGNARRLGGPFGSEKIAGSYLQRFSFLLLFSFFCFTFFKKLSSKQNIILFLIASIVVIFGLIYAGNRMPFFMFLFTCFLIFVFKKEVRIQFLIVFFFSIGILLVLYNSNLEIKKHYGHFQTKVEDFFQSFSSENLVNNSQETQKSFDQKNYIIQFNDKNYRMTSTHVKDFFSGISTWRSKPLFGGGVKTFKYNCPKVFYNCTTHPHNYYLEILADLGIFGLILVMLVFFLLVKKAIFSTNYYIGPFIYVFISEIFPLKSTGSFFTTANATFIFLYLAIIAGIIYKKKIE